MPGMAITVCLSVKKTITSWHSLLLGDDIVIKQPLKGTSLLEMGTLGDMIR